MKRLMIAICLFATATPVLAAEAAEAVEAVEVRRALVMNAAASDPGGKIAALVKGLEAKGFDVVAAKSAAKDGWETYERFLRAFPEGGVGVIYYHGPLDAVMENNRIVFKLRLGGVKKLPSAHALPESRDRDKRMPAVPPPLGIAPLKDRLGRRAVRQSLVVFDFTEIVDKAKDPKQDARKLESGLPHQVRSLSGLRNFSAMNKPGKTLLADRVVRFMGDNKVFNDKSVVGGYGAPKGGKFELKHKPARVVSPPSKFIAGKKAGDHWMDRNGMVFIWCPPGEFVMGDKQFEDAQPVPITISKGFWIGKYELTRASAALVRLQSSSHFGREMDLPFYGTDCSKTADAMTHWRKHLQAVGLNISGWNYDIPTEAEWEYAARAGKTNPDAVDPVALAGYGNFADRTLFQNPKDTHFIYADRKADDGYGHDLAPIGSYKPNAWGIHDMLGNLAEHVCTQYTESLTGGVDPNLLGSKDGRSMPRYVIRGGAWCSPATYLHPAHRSIMANAGTLAPYSGVRLIIRQGEPRALSHTDLRNMAKAAIKKKK
jgi:formylglycine-generating enzyme required for sulfatase activity